MLSTTRSALAFVTAKVAKKSRRQHDLKIENKPAVHPLANLTVKTGGSAVLADPSR